MNTLLEDHRLEIENRIRNLFWTISGDYSMDIQPDVETFAISRPLALYDAIKQGAFARHFDLEKLAVYALKKCSLGAKEAPLMELIQLCVDAAAYPKANMERSGIAEIRQQAFRDYLRIDRESNSQIIDRIRKSLMRRFLEELDTCSDDLLPSIQKIEGLSNAEDTDNIIRTVDDIYNIYLPPGFGSFVQLSQSLGKFYPVDCV